MGYSLITGACGGLGKEIVKKALKRKEKVFLTGRNAGKLEVLKNELLNVYKNACIEYYVVNLEIDEEVTNFFTYIEEKNIRFSALYYVAGADIQKPFENYSIDMISFQCRSILEGSLKFSNFAYKRRDGRIKMLIVSSISGITPMPYFAEYSCLKSAQINFFKAFKREIDKNDAYITILAPSSMPTRQDIKEDIKKQGLQGKLATKSVEFVTEKAFKSLDKNKTLCIPGAYNKFIYFISRITPSSIKCKVIAKKFSKKQKDNFFN